jgi:hypothetical protein
MVSCGHFVVNSWSEMRSKLAPKNTPTFLDLFLGDRVRAVVPLRSHALDRVI